MFLLDQKCFESIFVFFVNFFLYLVQGFDFLFFSERIASLLTALGYYLENSRYWVVAAPILVGTNMIRIAQMVSSLSHSVSIISFIFSLLQHMLSNMYAFHLFQLFLI